MDSHRDELENKCASLDFLQSTADMCFSNLTEWANYTIFNKHQGELTYDLILDERVNARVISYVHHPYKVKIEVTYGMLRAIYKECLAYPAYCKKLEEDGWEFNAFDDEFEGAQLLFSGGVPSREGANKRGNSSRLTQSFHFFMFEPIFSPVNALNQPI